MDKDIRLALMTGVDIPVENMPLVIHQPTVKEISMISEREFFTGAQCLTIKKSMFAEDKTLLENSNNFQIFMTVMASPETIDKKASVLQVLSLLFPNYKVIFTPRSLVLNSEEGNFTIDESNFEQLQEYFDKIFCVTNGPMDQQSYNPANAKAKEIAEKLMRGRQRVAEQNGSANQSIFTQYASILTIGIQSMGLDKLINLTMFQMLDLMERYMLYVNWDIDLKTRLAGGKPDKQPDNWMKNLH